jgi:transcriptional regulator with XRE-family HTH domain
VEKRKWTINSRDAEIGRRLKDARERLGFTQQDFASQVGLQKKRLASYEELRAALRYDLALRICRQFIISEKWLATGQGHWRVLQDLEAEPLVRSIPVDCAFSAAWADRLGARYESLFKAQGGEPRIVPHGGENDLFIANLLGFLLPNWLSAVGTTGRREFLALMMDFGNFAVAQFQSSKQFPRLDGITQSGFVATLVPDNSTARSKKQTRKTAASD